MELLGLEGPLEVIYSSSPAEAGSLEQVSQECIQVSFEYFQRGRLHNLPGQPVPVFCHPQCKEFFPHVEVELLVV